MSKMSNAPAESAPEPPKNDEADQSSSPSKQDNTPAQAESVSEPKPVWQQHAVQCNAMQRGFITVVERH